jgi:hypothetical protein
MVIVFQFVKATVYSMRSSVGWFGVVGLCSALMACDGKPPVGSGIGGSGDSSGGASAGGGAPSTGGTDGSTGGSNPGVAGTNGTFLPPDDGTGGTQACRPADSCEESECGPIADGCGAFIECGGCEAPATCGGAGVPSHCGIPGTDGTGTCTPATCDSLGMECGQHGNGCGGVVTCASCTGDGEECVQGQCQQTTSCTPLTCADYPEPGRCGRVTDGCSSTLDCDDFVECPQGQRCGAVEPGFCGVVTCTPWTCEEALAGKPSGYCGFVSNGCDGELVGCATVCGDGMECGTDVDGVYTEICGPSGSSGGCTPTDQATACAGKCGMLSDGCASAHTCGGCGVNQICGANNNQNVCGAAACVPITCDDLLAECGEIEDGCGELLDCGDCDGGDTCAGGGVPFECGSPQCVPYTDEEACEAADAGCGPQTDGCSGVVDCGSCPNGQTCGGGGTPNQCGTSCTPLTCQAIGATCGPQSNGCGGQIASCGPCDSDEVCQGTPSTCIPNLCTNLCQDRATCSPGQQTSITGTVYAPNGTEPLYNALVYVPNLANLANLPTISAGPTCERCEDEDLGEPLVAAVTGPDGRFTLRDVPAEVEFPLVVKMGKWRRVTMVPAVDACSSNVLAADDARLPRHMNDAAPGLEQHVNIPKFALTTGRVDAIECVMRKVGIADSEFTAPTGNGRIHLYRGMGSGNPAYPGAGTSRTNGIVTGTADTALFSGNTLNNYDVAIFDCEGKEIGRNTTRENTLRSFANAGGRVFASHYSYTYLNEKDPGQATNSDNNRFADTATWGGSQSTEANAHNPTTGIIDLSHDKGQAFDSWLGDVNALHPTYGDGYISIIDPRGYVRAVNASTTERFVYTDADHLVPGYSGQGAQPNGDINVQSAVQQYSFNTPVGAPADEACGRVLYSAFHVAGTNLDTSNSVFPEHCNNSALTPQEKILEFMIFDLSACVSTTVPPSCTPTTCQNLGVDCGYVSDGCGGLLECGTCVPPESCGGGGTPNVCGSTCTLRTCASAGATCGVIGDGCGGTLDCGTCPTGTCGGGGTPNVCGAPPCTPRTCQQAGATCGDIGNGCGGTLHCGTCVAPQFCGGGGPNTCGTTTCTPTSCEAEDANCGTIGDGCGNAINCGVCPPGSSCGAGGPNKCGPTCTPTTCLLAGKNCGSIGDGCGGVLNCGPCSEGTVCGGGGTPNVCGGSCVLVTCQSSGAACGTISDGCGGVRSCGTCPAGQVCGANGVANQCGTGSCTPDTCGSLCGPQSNGCSGTLDCGPCDGCVPLTCVPNVDCGPIADGCGDLIDCGGCINGNTCGGGGEASKCGGAIQ